MLDASSNTCIDGLVLKKVPVYSFPSLVLIMQYSESKVGTIGPPTKSNFKVPFGVIDLTIAPKVSTWAANPITFSSLSPGMVITPHPLLVNSRSYPRLLTILSTFSIISKQNPLGLWKLKISFATSKIKSLFILTIYFAPSIYILL